MRHHDAVGDPYLVITLVGTVAFAVSGAAAAVRVGMDWLGVAVLAVITAVGGGTIRDLLTGALPVGWIRTPWPLWVALATAAVVIVVARRVPVTRLESWHAMVVADAAGLAAFTVTGTVTSLAAGLDPGVAALLGVVAGTGGGVLRDVLARERPLILVGQIYALAALAGALAVVALQGAGAPELVTRWAPFALILGLRLAAVRWGWSLPRFRPTQR